MKLGIRVRVAIEEAAQWNKGAVESLNGKTGRIEGKTKDGSLVAFDYAAAPWWKGQSPPKSWWFLDEELIELTEGPITDS